MNSILQKGGEKKLVKKEEKSFRTGEGNKVGVEENHNLESLFFSRLPRMDSSISGNASAQKHNSFAMQNFDPELVLCSFLHRLIQFLCSRERQTENDRE